MRGTKQIRVGIIGGGVGGIAAAVMLRQRGIHDFTIFEKSDGPGGTWWDNRYPGAACDVISKLYSFSFNRKLDWSRSHARQPEILAYLQSTIDKFGIRKNFRFGTQIVEGRWADEEQLWHLRSAAGETFEYNVIVSAVGLLNVPNIPNFPGIAEFQGTIMHTSRWQDVDLTGKTVAVIGTGSSSAQVVPSIASKVGKLLVYQREPGWLVPNDEKDFTSDEITRNSRRPFADLMTRWWNFWMHQLASTVVTPGSRVHRQRTQKCLDWLASAVKSEETRRLLTPNYPFNCKRPVKDPNYLLSFNRDNVELVPYAVDRFTRDGLISQDSTERKVDIVILATGFKAADFLSTITLTGRHNVTLKEKWDSLGGPEAFAGVAISGFPNLFLLYGPNSNSASGSLIFVLETQAQYMARSVAYIKSRRLGSVEIKSRWHERYNSWLQKKIPNTTWTTGCNNYYNSPTGKLVTNWPHTAVLYWAILQVFQPIFPFLFHKTKRRSKKSTPACRSTAVTSDGCEKAVKEPHHVSVN